MAKVIPDFDSNNPIDPIILLIHVLSILKNLFYIWSEVLSYIPNLGSMERMVRFFMGVEYLSYNSCFNRFYIIKFLR